MDHEILLHRGPVLAVLAPELLQVVVYQLDVPLQGTCGCEGLVTLIAGHSINVVDLLLYFSDGNKSCTRSRGSNLIILEFRINSQLSESRYKTVI